MNEFETVCSNSKRTTVIDWMNFWGECVPLIHGCQFLILHRQHKKGQLETRKLVRKNAPFVAKECSVRVTEPRC